MFRYKYIMKKVFFLLLSFLLSCSNDDSITPIDNTEKEVVLNLEWESETAPFLPQGLVYDILDKPYFYVAAKGGGLFIFRDSETANPNQIATVPISDLSNLHVMNIYQSGNYVYLSLGDFFGGNSKAGLAIIDVSDPTSPMITDIWESTEVISGSAIVIVEDNYAYLGGMNHGLFIFDISDPSSITEVKQYLPDVNFPEENPGDVAHPNARGMAIKGNHLYLCYDAGGIRVIDITDKQNPNEIGRYINDTAQENTPKAYNNIILDGNYAYVSVDYCGFEVLDISDFDNITRIGWWNPWNCDSLSNIWLNSPGHSNQMCFDAENSLVFLATGKSELSIIDVTNPKSPALKSSFGTPDNSLATWGVTLKGNDVYLLYITATVPLYSNWTGLKKLKWGFE